MKSRKGFHSKRFSPFLIHGITGSGKTEIYLRAIEEVLAQGKEAIVLVPEISLTPQLLSRFRDRFGENLALLHSKLGRGERYDQWRKFLRGDVGIAIGARSAIFAPFKRLGIIIVDEEHDPSYKQEEKLKYHARDLAVVRAQQAEATLLLGSATPSLESYSNAEKGKFRLLQLPAKNGREIASPCGHRRHEERRRAPFPEGADRTSKKHRGEETEPALSQPKGIFKLHPLSRVRVHL